MANVIKRPMTPKERRYVEKDLEDEESRKVSTGNAANAFLRNLRNSAIGVGAVILLGLTVADDWTDFDMFSPRPGQITVIVIGGLVLAVVIALVMTWAFFKSPVLEYDPEDAEDARRALADGQVIEETHEVIDAMQVVMEDKDGLTYFLLTLDNRVFYWEDEESEDLWCDDKSIFDSKARPLSRLIITTTAVGDIEFDIRFEGAPVPFNTGLRFKKGAEDEFDCDEFVDAIIWDDIEDRFTRPYPEAARRMA